MGTFHKNMGELHGVTVAVNTTGEKIYVGRCHEANERTVILLDVDEHTAGDQGLSKEQYVQRAAQWGVFKKHDHFIVPADQVASITPLGEIAAGGGAYSI